jgi:hypothetical protein
MSVDLNDDVWRQIFEVQWEIYDNILVSMQVCRRWKVCGHILVLNIWRPHAELLAVSIRAISLSCSEA